MATKNQSTDIVHLQQDLRDLENYMEAFTSFLPLAVAIVNTQGIVIDTNDAFASFTGYENPGATGAELSDFFTEVDTLSELLSSLDGMPGGIRRANLTLKTKGGKEKPARLTLAKRQDASGRHTGYFASIGDIGASDAPPAPRPEEKSLKELSDEQAGEFAKQTKAAEGLAVEHEKNLAIIDGVRDGILVISDGKKIDLINQRAAEMLSLDREGLIGESFDKLTEKGELEPLTSKISEGQKELEKMEVEGEAFEVALEYTSVQEHDYCIVTLHDISRDQFVEDMKLTFVSVAAHQIRTPLSSIRWSLELLANQIQNEEQRKVAQRGYRSTQNILEIVNGLLNLDKIQSGKDGYNFDSIDITEIIESYVSEVREHNQVLDQPDIFFHQPTDPLPKVRGDQEKLRIVFRNLIDNAMKYTDSDGQVNIKTSVHVTNDYSNDMVRITVQDNGIGIPPQAQEKIFSKFYRAGNARLAQTDGSGIGLYITKRIVEEHDGTIWFESTEGEGTSFFVELPIAQSQD